MSRTPTSSAYLNEEVSDVRSLTQLAHEVVTSSFPHSSPEALITRYKNNHSDLGKNTKFLNVRKLCEMAGLVLQCTFPNLDDFEIALLYEKSKRVVHRNIPTLQYLCNKIIASTDAEKLAVHQEGSNTTNDTNKTKIMYWIIRGT